MDSGSLLRRAQELPRGPAEQADTHRGAPGATRGGVPGGARTAAPLLPREAGVVWAALGWLGWVAGMEMDGREEKRDGGGGKRH